jgi:hypothetical protein
MCNKSQGFYGLNSTLSPEAQAVLDAYMSTSVRPVANRQLAAALRAAADEVWFVADLKLLNAIADELEGIKYGTYRCNLEDKPQ